MSKDKTIILGAGITGLSAGTDTGKEIYEANDIPGGICASYYGMANGSGKNYLRINEESYRFEIGGGHWIFGIDNGILNFINSFSIVKAYKRKSAVFFPNLNLYIPYPIQNHLYYLPQRIRKQVLKEIIPSGNKSVSTLADWLELNFGKTLCELFFFPFHQLYTTGLYKKIIPQNRFKTPVNKDLILEGARKMTKSAVGYNIKFVYPENGLDDLMRKMAKRCKVYYNKKAKEINLEQKEIIFEDGSITNYGKIFSILPLNKMLEMTKIKPNEKAAPFISVLVINIGAERKKGCPDCHWIYVPKSKSGFYRVGFYSNVDKSFLPLSSRRKNNRVSIYVEKAYEGGRKPKQEAIKKLLNSVVEELQEWEFIGDLEIIGHSWIEVAYTWEYPNSQWKQQALDMLAKHNIFQIGRYGRWRFQGIAESIKDGLSIKNSYG